MTLDFDLHIIPNNVAFPRPMAFYISEMQRALFNIGQLTGAAYKHTGYMINFIDQVVMQAIADFKKKLDDEIADLTTKSDAMNTKLNDLNTGLDGLKGKESDFETSLNTSLANLKTQMDQLNLISKDNLKSSVIELIKSGDIDVNDPISDEAQAILDDWNKTEVTNDGK